MSPDWSEHDIVINAEEIEHIHVRYPAEIFDAEAMAVDPLNGDILIFTKDHNNAVCNVFKVPHGAGDPKTMEYITTFPIWSVTGADISPSGDTLALINYSEGFSWSKPACGRLHILRCSRFSVLFFASPYAISSEVILYMATLHLKCLQDLF